MVNLIWRSVKLTFETCYQGKLKHSFITHPPFHSASTFLQDPITSQSNNRCGQQRCWKIGIELLKLLGLGKRAEFLNHLSSCRCKSFVKSEKHFFKLKFPSILIQHEHFTKQCHLVCFLKGNTFSNIENQISRSYVQSSLLVPCKKRDMFF